MTFPFSITHIHNITDLIVRGNVNAKSAVETKQVQQDIRVLNIEGS